MRALLLLLAMLSLGAEPRWSVRSRLFLRLDPTAKPNPDGSAEPGALGQFRLVARDGMEAEAAGWLGHAPGAAPSADDALVGDVTTLRARGALGPVWVEGGRHWTALGGLRLTRLTGVSAGMDLGQGFEAAARVGLSGEQPHDFFGETLEFGGELRSQLPADVLLTVGGLAFLPPDGPARTRWSFSSHWTPTSELQAHGAATVDVVARALVEARLELASQPIKPLWLRGYGRYAEIDQLLPFGDLLAVFTPDARGELGALGEWTLSEALQLRLDGAWVGIREAHTGGRLRSAVEIFPAAGTRVTLEATGTSSVAERAALLRIGGRAPIKGSVFATLEVLGDFIEGVEPGGVSRAGAGFEPWPGWFAYGALEVGRSERWAERLAGLVMLEHALGAPVRWGGAP